MHLSSESQIVDAAFRARILQEINGSENMRRKAAAFRAYETFKDRTDQHVMSLLLAQFDQATVHEMQYAITNISFLRKVVDKLARVYSAGVKRTMSKARDTKAVEQAAEALHINQRMRKLNKYLRLFKNTMAYVKPCERGDKYDLDVQVLAPFLYDVIEDPYNPEEPLVVILSDYSPEAGPIAALDPALAGRAFNGGTRQIGYSRGDGRDQIIADSPLDRGAETDKKQYIWWSPNYHFTTNSKGAVVSDGDGLNPIGILPFVNFAQDQDGSFWALGGGDLVESAIKINALMTHITHIAVSQGYGQLTMTGKNLPKSVKVGPNHCIQVEYQEGEPTPSVNFLTANPPVSELMGLVEMYVALLLSTNNLSTSGFSASLKGSQGFASGIALLIDKSESIEAVEEQAQIFRDNEPEIWKIISRWKTLYGQRGLLVDSLQRLALPVEMDLDVSFIQAQAIMSESEKLDIIQKRRELGLNSEIELLMRDDPSLTEESAAEKLLKIQEEKMARVQAAIEAMPAATEPEDEAETETEDEEPAQESDQQEEQ